MKTSLSVGWIEGHTKTISREGGGNWILITTKSWKKWSCLFPLSVHVKKLIKTSVVNICYKSLIFPLSYQPVYSWTSSFSTNLRIDEVSRGSDYDKMLSSHPESNFNELIRDITCQCSRTITQFPSQLWQTRSSPLRTFSYNHHSYRTKLEVEVETFLLTRIKIQKRLYLNQPVLIVVSFLSRFLFRHNPRVSCHNLGTWYRT